MGSRGYGDGVRGGWFATDGYSGRYRSGVPVEPTPFVLGGRLRRPSWAGSRASIVSIAVVLAVVAAPVRGLYRATGSSMEEGFMLVFPKLVQQGQAANEDFSMPKRGRVSRVSSATPT
jgi:hypothetical protein